MQPVFMITVTSYIDVGSYVEILQSKKVFRFRQERKSNPDQPHRKLQFYLLL
jgi:hypothetical protein